MPSSMYISKKSLFYFLATMLSNVGITQSLKPLPVTISKVEASKINVFIGNKLFTSFLMTDSLEKPVFYPIIAANGTTVTRGFPLHPLPGEPIDHPHHVGMWFNFENVNGLDFWNNSYAIPSEKKNQYGWIRVTNIKTAAENNEGSINYKANWTNQLKDVLISENTIMNFSGNAHQRIIDRQTILTAMQDITFNDAKDGLLGLRLAHQLQIPEDKDQKFTDSKGIVTIVKGGTDHIPNGNYLTSEGKQGNDAWSTRAKWCMVYGKMESDSISIVMIDHPENPNFPSFWHARGYGLFAVNPLGEKIFTEGKSSLNLHLNKGESVTFRYRIIINNDNKILTSSLINKSAQEFSKKKFLRF